MRRSRHSRYIFKAPWKRMAASAFDAFGSLFFRPRPRPKDIRRILLMRMDQTGDAIFAEPALHYLRGRFPAARIDFLAGPWAAPLVRQFEGVGEVLVFPGNWYAPERSVSFFSRATRAMARTLRAGNYDLGIDLRGDLRNIALMREAGIPYVIGYGITGGRFLLDQCMRYDFHAHQVELNLRLVAAPQHPPDKDANAPRFSCPAPNTALLEKIGWIREKSPKILIQTDAGYASKQWKSERFAQLIATLLAKGIKPVLIGTQSDQAYAHLGVYDLRGQTDLLELCGLIGQADLLIGHDSAPAHMAAALGTPCVVLFSGANDPARWRPLGDNVRLLFYPVKCSPCESKQCLMPRHECMDALRVLDVETAVEKALAQSGFKL